ncbi:DUF4102 domain-containing protein [bacterium]|nr:DUF4102 domain-containing protein [candidate division CSSED10-310 bacterium]
MTLTDTRIRNAKPENKTRKLFDGGECSCRLRLPTAAAGV